MDKQQKRGTSPITLFYSYAHEDEPLRQQLETHLAALRRQGLISEWHDGKILPGAQWAREIVEHLESASIILLLISPDFLDSDYIYEIEMQRALERHKRGEARVIPIILRPADWQTSPLASLQSLPPDGKAVTTWPNPDEAFLAIAKGLRRVIERQQLPRHPLPEVERKTRRALIKQVRTTWIEGLLEKSLHEETRLELHLQKRPDVLANQFRLQYQELDRAPESLPTGTSIVQVYDKADGKLLILGKPGAGKTTLLLELARALLVGAEADENERLPVVFNLSSWAAKQQRLTEWMIEELIDKYQVPRKIGQSWVADDKVLPLLDGLDEVAREARIACIRQINSYYDSRLEHGGSPIVVCCRSKEFRVLLRDLQSESISLPRSTRVGFNLQYAVGILPLTDEQINTYLEQGGEQVKKLREFLDEDTKLRELAREPLMLNIFTLAYQGETSAEVLKAETPERMRDTIFAKYVESMLTRRRELKRWRSDQVIRWLAFLAKQMQWHDQTIFSVENLQPTWLSGRRSILSQVFVGLSFRLGPSILRLLLSWQGNLPWALIPFLDEATERLFLRKAGGGYIFVHRLLRDYFANLDRGNDRIGKFTVVRGRFGGMRVVRQDFIDDSGEDFIEWL
jgi:DNA polymerase III delta prime subunit